MTIRMIGCEPNKPPEEMWLPEPLDSVSKFLEGWFEVVGLGNKLLLYCNEHPIKQSFNRMVRGRPIYGNFLISKLGRGKRTNLNDDEVNELIAEFNVPSKNETN